MLGVQGVTLVTEVGHVCDGISDKCFGLLFGEVGGGSVYDDFFFFRLYFPSNVNF